MDEYFIPMSETLRRKYYPNGYFSAGQKTLRNSAIFVYVVFGIIAVLATLFVVMCIRAMWESGEGAISGLPIILLGLALLIFSIGMIVVFVKRCRMSMQQWIEKFAEKNGLTISDIHEFDKQVTLPNTLILHMAGKQKALFLNVGIGLLTNDYVTFGDDVMKRKDIVAAYLFDHIEIVETDCVSKICHIIHTVLISKHGVIDTEVKQEAGEHLIELLKQSNANMRTREEVLEEKEFQNLLRIEQKKLDVLEGVFE